MEYCNYHNSIKNNTCFKGDSSCTDLIRKYCFENTSSFKTGDHHHLNYLMFNTTFEKAEFRNFTYLNLKQFQWETFEKDLKNSLKICNCKYEQNLFKMLYTHAPKNNGNIYKFYYKKNLRKTIINRSRLKNKANRTENPVVIANYNKERTLTVSLSCQTKS